MTNTENSLRIIKYAEGDYECHEETATFVNYCFFDGYAIDNRHLEQVMIKVELTEDKKDIIVSGIPDHLNVQKYLKRAKEYALQNDCFASEEDQDDDRCSLQRYHAGIWHYVWEKV